MGITLGGWDRATRSQAHLHRDQALPHGPLQLPEVLLVDLRVSLGKIGDGLIEAAARPEVRGNRDPVARRACARAKVQPQTEA